MARKKRQVGRGLSAAGDVLSEVADLLAQRRREELEQEALAHSQQMEEGRLGLARERFDFEKEEASARREAAEQAEYEKSLPGHKAKAYQHELGAGLTGLSGRYAEAAGPLAGKQMSKAFEEAGSIDEVNALMTQMGMQINEMDKLTQYESWYKEQPPNVQQYLDWRAQGGDVGTGQLLYMLDELMVREGLKAETKAKTQPPKMSEEERRNRATVEYWQKFFATSKGFEYVKMMTPWEGEISDEGKIEDPRDVATYKTHVKTLIKDLANLTDEQAAELISDFMITPEDVKEISVEGEEFDIESILKEEK